MISSRTPHRRYARRRVDHRRRNRRPGAAWCWWSRCSRWGSAPAHLAVTASRPARRWPLRPPSAKPPTGRRTLESLATAGDGLQMDVPITQKRITAIVYHGGGTRPGRADARRATSTTPICCHPHLQHADRREQLQRPGVLHRLQRRAARRPERWTSARWPAPACTRRPTAGSSPCSPYVISGKTYGSVIQIQPAAAPAVILTITNIKRSTAIVGRQAGDAAAETAAGHRHRPRPPC